jgi:LuxR family maltose regulon positive regulatory protein
MRLVILSRQDPALPLSRLRVHRQMVEIRQRDLEFTEEEAAAFLRQETGLALSDADVAVLHERTEGWIAGLQLLALSMSGRGDASGVVESLAGSHRYILDYLVEEVFDRQPPEVQRFLLETAILERFTAALCDRVTERDDAHQMLLSLEHANLFLVSLDESRNWYRYHHLFADLLRHRLQIERGDEVPLLHRRASQWYAENDLLADAIGHATAAADWKTAAVLIDRASPSLLSSGQVDTLLGWFGALPPEVIDASPALCIGYGWSLILRERADDAQRYLDQVEVLAQGQPALLGQVAAARAHVARSRGDVGSVLAFSQKALSLLPEDDLSARSIVAVNLGMIYWYGGALDQAEEALQEARRAAAGSGNDYARLTALLFLNRIDIARGRLRRGAAFCREVIAQGEQVPILSLFHHDVGTLLYEWDDLDAAADQLERGIELCRRHGTFEWSTGSYALLARVREVQGRSADAQAALDEIDRLLDQLGIPLAAHLYIATQRVCISLARGNLAEASSLLERLPVASEEGPFADRVSIMHARACLLLAQGRQTEAAAQIEALLAALSGRGWEHNCVQALTLQAVVAPSLDDGLVALAQALAVAEPEGYRRTFLDLGEPLIERLQAFCGRKGADPGLLAFARTLLEAFSEPPSPGDRSARSATARQPSSLLEPLTGRELEVLGLLAKGQTNQEIAQVLYLSVNTVKTHLKNIYAKLDVHSRRQAVNRSRTLGLLS